MKCNHAVLPCQSVGPHSFEEQSLCTRICARQTRLHAPSMRKGLRLVETACRARQHCANKKDMTKDVNKALYLVAAKS